MKIGIFDSGVGGLGIFDEIRKRIPKASIIYIADSINCPYGEKPTKRIQAICKKNTKFLLNLGADIIVVACNSASVSALNWLRTQFTKVPIIGVVPVIKTAAKMTKKIGVLATKRTINSKYFQGLIDEFAPQEEGYKIVYQSCGKLVDVVEQGDDKDIFIVLTKCLKPFIKNKVDYIVLGCTHFPFAHDQIKKVLGRKVKILDSNAAVARQVKRVATGMRNSECRIQNEKYQFYTSGDVEKVSKVSQKLLRDKSIKFKQI